MIKHRIAGIVYKLFNHHCAVGNESPNSIFLPNFGVVIFKFKIPASFTILQGLQSYQGCMDKLNLLQCTGIKTFAFKSLDPPYP